MKGGESAEFKFVIAGPDKKLVWEEGKNRVLNLPKEGNYVMVCHWNNTTEALDLVDLGSEGIEDSSNSGSGNGSIVAEPDSASKPTISFVEQWQGRAASFMRSNDYQSGDAQRNRDTSGLEGLSLKLVEGDQSARNWWRKVFSYGSVPLKAQLPDGDTDPTIFSEAAIVIIGLLRSVTC